MYFHPQAFADIAGRFPMLDGVRGPRLAARSRKVLFPFDDSQAARTALEFVIAAEKDQRSEVHVVNVQQPTIDDRIFLEAVQGAAEELLRAASLQLHENRIPHTSEVAFGPTAETLVRCAARERCTEIIMGTRARSAIAELFCGSVSARVVRLTEIPVTLIRQTGPAQ